MALLSLFAISYGFFGGGFSATWSGVLSLLKKEDEERDGVLETGLVFGLLAGGRGVGNVVCGPLSGKLIGAAAVAAGDGEVGTAGGYGTQYRWLIVFTGLTALFGGWGWFWRVGRKMMVV